MNSPNILKLLVLAVAVVAMMGCGTPAPTDGAESSPTVATSAPPAPPPPSSTQTQAPAPPAQTRAPAPPPPPPPAAPQGAPRVERPTPPPPPPEPVTVTVPAGTAIDVAFLDSVASNESQVGDPVRLRVISDIRHDGVAAIPAGSVVLGAVTEVKGLDKKIGGRARIGLEFHTLELTSGRTAAIHTTFSEEGKSETKKDAATIGGATAGGALLGRIIDQENKDNGLLIGAVVGAAAGTAIAAKTEGKEIIIASGTEVSLQLDQPAHITITP